MGDYYYKQINNRFIIMTNDLHCNCELKIETIVKTYTPAFTRPFRYNFGST